MHENSPKKIPQNYKYQSLTEQKQQSAIQVSENDQSEIQEKKNISQKKDQINSESDVEIYQLNQKSVKNIKPLIIRSLFISFGAIYTGYILGSYSFVQPTMKYVLDNDSGYIDGLCNALVTIGTGIGSFLANYLLNQKVKKRRTCIIIADLIGLLACFLQMIPSLWFLMPGRLLGGIASGFNFLICPIYIKEFVPIEYLGTCISMYSNSVNIGVMFSYIVGFTLHEDVSKNVPFIWRLNLAFPILFLIIRFIAINMFYKLDTPAYYFEQNDQKSAKQAMLQTYDKESLQNAIQFYLDQMKQVEQTKVEMKQLLSPQYRKRFLMAMFSSASEALSGLMIFTAYSWMIYGNVVKSQNLNTALCVTQVIIQMLGTAILVIDLVPQSGVSCANAFMAFFNSIYSFGFPVLIDNGVPLWSGLSIIVICDVFLLLIFKFWVIETKGLTETQLNQIFSKVK
ncbi:Major facilitator superfamily domain, general substrate transporter [Pseudocohnilembus persalinus]|uniref:Major facilitator superfamily domain, general substrate transporter n=1 Tax=Pseudocohnilembus persalinus TaxID=266149 RepID=A0A0V0R5G5_PSEPJ|nr:Major facilitator superfamily domain, general substrate transporter [Pseudocohnilembus persalinus]|eukprot:KRX09723.1 Major facilitator superfamily domain, general substrate transporter [Pseudocohnilembus persalinus]